MAEAPDFLNLAYREAHTNPSLACYRQLVRRAVPFVLDEAATVLLTQLASNVKQAYLFRKLARLPYDAVWLEIDYLAKVRTQLALGTRQGPYNPEHEPTHMAYLIEKIGDTRWRAVPFVDGGELDTLTFPVCYVLDTEETLANYHTSATHPGLAAWMEDMTHSRQAEALAWGAGVELKSGRQGLISVDHSGSFDIAPDWEERFKQLMKRNGPHAMRDRFFRAVEDSSRELAGGLRYLAAALALINETPLTLKEVHRKGAFRSKDGRIRPYIVNRHVTIALPKSKYPPVKQVLRLFEGAHRAMKRHQVRGHWRRVRHKVDGNWAYRRKWVDAFERGDASLGYVHHVYDVVT